ncbi:MAG: DNA polymerase III subunit delta [Gemmatimonadota bacterium]
MSLPAEARLDRLLHSGELSGAFFFHGDAARLRDEGVRRLLDAALDPATRDFNLTFLRGGDLRPENLEAALAMPPLMAARRVVVLTEAERVSPGARKSVLAALDRIPSDVTFVISATVPAGSKAAFYRTLRERCTELRWMQPRAQEVPGWAIERARTQHGFELPAEAAQVLAGAAGADLSRLDAELAKLASVAGGGAVTCEQVRELVSDVRRVDRWEWLDQVASRRYEEALANLEPVLGAERGVGLLASMVDHHLYVGLAGEGGAGLARQALAEAGKPYLTWKARVYAEQARAWRPGEIPRALRLFRRADRQLKSGGGERAVLEELLLALGALGRRAA